MMLPTDSHPEKVTYPELSKASSETSRVYLDQLNTTISLPETVKYHAAWCPCNVDNFVQQRFLFPGGSIYYGLRRLEGKYTVRRLRNSIERTART